MSNTKVDMSYTPSLPSTALNRLQQQYEQERHGGVHTNTNANTNTNTNYPQIHITDDQQQQAPYTDAHHMYPRSAGTVPLTAGIPHGAPTVTRNSDYENRHPNFSRMDGARPSHATLHEGFGAAGAVGKNGLDISGPMMFPQTHVFLQPIAAPQALGMAAWASTAFVFGAWLADWYGTDATALAVWPFFLTMGGIAQFAAGMWSFRSRDTLSSVVHTIWAGFWLAIGLYYATRPEASSNFNNGASVPHRWSFLDNFAIWLVPVAAFTWVAAIASLLRDVTLTAILSTMATGATLSLIGWFAPSMTVVKIGAYFWIVGSIFQLFRVFTYFIHEHTKNEKHMHLPTYHNNSRWRDDWRNGVAYPFREPGVTAAC